MRKYLSLFLLITAFVPLIIQAQTVEIEKDLPCDRGNSLIELIDRIINFIFLLVLGIAPIMIIVAGFYFITAAGNSEKINTAKKMILWTLIGLLIVFCAKGLIILFRVC